MTSSFRTTRRVEFRDTDAAGIMHFSVFFTAMESAEQEFLRSRGLGVLLPHPDGDLGFPRVAARCDYQSPLKFEDEYQIDVRIARIGGKSVTYEFAFTQGDRAIATGEMTSVCCRMTPNGNPTPIAIPDWISERLRGEAK